MGTWSYFGFMQPCGCFFISLPQQLFYQKRKPDLRCIISFPKTVRPYGRPYVSWVLSYLLCSLHLRCIPPTVFLSHTKPAPATSTSQPTVFFFHKKSAPATSTSQPNTVILFTYITYFMHASFGTFNDSLWWEFWKFWRKLGELNTAPTLASLTNGESRAVPSSWHMHI